MSRYLAPIHNWLFNKIRLFEELEEQLIQNFRLIYGTEVEGIVVKYNEKYGYPLEDKPLEELIDTSNIHGWLQNRITIAETRQSAILTEIFIRFGSEAVDSAMAVYKSNGASCGEIAKKNFEVGTAPAIYEALNNFILDGMPCDNVNNVMDEDEENLVWKTTRCLHRDYWEAAGAEVDIFYKLRKQWVLSFVENANDKYTYIEEVQDFSGMSGFRREIKKVA